MKKCSAGQRHRWQFIKNTTVRRQTVSSIQFSLRGVYKCKCGVAKYGEPMCEARQEPEVGL